MGTGWGWPVCNARKATILDLTTKHNELELTILWIVTILLKICHWIKIDAEKWASNDGHSKSPARAAHITASLPMKRLPASQHTLYDVELWWDCQPKTDHYLDAIHRKSESLPWIFEYRFVPAWCTERSRSQLCWSVLICCELNTLDKSVSSSSAWSCLTSFLFTFPSLFTKKNMMTLYTREMLYRWLQSSLRETSTPGHTEPLLQSSLPHCLA